MKRLTVEAESVVAMPPPYIAWLPATVQVHSSTSSPCSTVNAKRSPSTVQSTACSSVPSGRGSGTGSPLTRTAGASAVPWIRIGPFELSGAHTPAELARWVDRAGSETGWQDYLREQLETGELDAAITASRRDPAARLALLALAADLDTPYAVRIGVGAVLEELGPEGRLMELVGPISETLAGSEHAQVRADAAHFLGLSGNPAAVEPLRALLQDPDAEVREIAGESLEELGD